MGFVKKWWCLNLRLDNRVVPTYSTCHNNKGSQEAQCLKITEKVSFNIASEASYLYILSGQLIKNARNGQLGEFSTNWSLRSNSVTRKVTFDRTKIGGQCWNSNATILSNFLTMWDCLELDYSTVSLQRLMAFHDQWLWP